MAFRHHEFAGVVAARIGRQVERVVADAVRQRLAIDGEATIGLAVGAGDAVLAELVRIAGDVLVDRNHRRRKLHPLYRHTVDDEMAVDHLDRVAGQADDPLDPVFARMVRRAEHDHVAARRLADLHDARVQHRQAQPVAPLVDEDEVALDQRRHHGIRRDAERLVQEGAQRQHDDDHREEGARVVDQQRLADDAAGPALRREPPAVEAPDGAGDRGQDHQHECEIEDHQ